MYSVIADTTPEKSDHDRLTKNIRYVTVANNRLKPVDRLSGIDTMSESKPGEALAKKAFKTLREKQLPERVFQSYNFAANMSREFNGAPNYLDYIFIMFSVNHTDGTFLFKMFAMQAVYFARIC